MGARQSAPRNTTIDTNEQSNETKNGSSSTSEESSLYNSDVETKMTTTKEKKKKAPLTLEGFALVEHKCRKKKNRYDCCYSQKQSAFVEAKKFQDKNGDDISCDHLFDLYRERVLFGMKKLREERGLSSASNLRIVCHR